MGKQVPKVLKVRSSRLKILITAIEETAAVTFMLCLTALLIFQVVSRYVFATPYPWSEELSRYFFIWTIFIGAAYIASKNGHIAVTFITESLPGHGGKQFVRLSSLLVSASSVVIAISGINFVITTAGLASPASGIPVSVIYIAPVIGFFLIALHSTEFILSGEEPEVVPEEMEALV